MPAATVDFRKIALEDLEVTSTPGTTFVDDVLTPTGPVPTTLTKIPIGPLSLLGVYANDGAAAAGGVVVGQVYISSSNGTLRTRMT